MAENKADGQAFDTDTVFTITGPFETVYEDQKHFPVGEADTCFHGECGRFGEAADQKGGKPPMTSGIADAVIAFIAQEEGTFQHFLFRGTGEPGSFVVLFGDDCVCMVYADLCTGVDAVLAFPEFDQPGPAAVIKVNRKCIKDHLEPGCHIVIEPGVSGLLLPGIYGGREDAAVAVEAVAERIDQFVYKSALGTAVHGVDLADDLFPAAVKEDTAEKSHKK